MKKFFFSAFLIMSSLALMTSCSDSDTKDSAPKMTVTFDSQGGSAVASITVEQGSKITKPTDPTKEGFIFVDWFKDQAGLTAWNFETDAVESNTTLYAKWTTETFTVTFNTNGGSTIEPVKVASGGKVAKPTNPTKAGSDFENWYSDVALTKVYDFSTAVTADLTINAKWTAQDLSELQNLVAEARGYNQGAYTPESYAVLKTKIEAAEKVLTQTNPTQEQIATALRELNEAIDGLVEKTSFLGTTIKVTPTAVDGIFLATQGQQTIVTAYVYGADGQVVDPSSVKFTYNEADFTPIVDGAIKTSGNSFSFNVKTDVVPGTTAPLTITSVENPSLTLTITIKIAADADKKQAFIDLINALPAPEDISYDDSDQLSAAYSFYFTLSNEEHKDPDVIAAYQKLGECDMAISNLPGRYLFTAFTDNVTNITRRSRFDDTDMGAYTYEMDEAFPAGVYTQNGSSSDWFGNLIQSRYTLYPDGTGIIESRKIASGTSPDPLHIRKDAEEPFTIESTITKYTCEGTQAEGGILYLTVLYQ